jgi:hypothetical protein
MPEHHGVQRNWMSVTVKESSMKIIAATLLTIASSLCFGTGLELNRITVHAHETADSVREDCMFRPGSLTKKITAYGTTEERYQAVTTRGDIYALGYDIAGATQPAHAVGDSFVNYWLFVDGGPAQLLRSETKDGVVVSESPNAAKLVRIMKQLCE